MRVEIAYPLNAVSDPSEHEPTQELVIGDLEDDNTVRARARPPLPPASNRKTPTARSSQRGARDARGSDEARGAPPSLPQPTTQRSSRARVAASMSATQAPTVQLSAPQAAMRTRATPTPPPPRASAPNPEPRAATPTPAPPRGSSPAVAFTHELSEEALLDRIREELTRNPEPARAARLHYDLGVLLERSESKPTRAAEHFRKAAEIRPDHQPSIQGARRTLLALGRHADALPLLDAEQKLCASPAERVRLLAEKGRLLELRLGRAEDALAAYREGLALDRRNVDLLRAIARIERRAERWDALDTALEQLAQAIERDAPFRAAVIAERARIADLRKRDTVRTTELYFAAMTADADAPGAAEAFKRLGQAQGHFAQLLEVYEREALLSAEPDVRAAARARMSELLDTELGDLEGAITAQEFATSERPYDRALLERLSELYARKGLLTEQLAVLERLRDLARDSAECASLCVRMGSIAEGALDDAQRAEGYYLAALEADATQRPALQALSALCARRNDHKGLIFVLTRELEIAGSDLEKADLLARMGALWEAGPKDVAQAVDLYARALGLCPDHEGALRALDRLWPALGRYRELVLAYEHVIDKLKAPEQAIAYLFRIGGLYEDRLDDPKGAVAIYERVLRLAPDHLGALHALGRAALRAGEHDKALRAILREAKLAPPGQRAAELLVRAAELLAGPMGDAKGAILQLEQVVKAEPKHTLAIARLRALYRSEQRWEALLAQLTRSYEQTTDPAARAELAIEIGRLQQHQLGRTGDAIAAYGRALAAQPLHALAFAALTALLRAQGKWAELGAALDARAKVCTDSGERALLYCELGRVLEERLNDPLRALEIYGRALEAQPGLRQALDARARLLWGRGDLPRLAKALHEEAAQCTDPRLAVAALERAAALEAEAIGDHKTALATYRSLLERAPQHTGALLAVEALSIQLRDRKALAANYAAQAEVATDERFKVSALRDLAQLAATPEEAADAYRALLALRGEDPEALTALAEQARAEGDLQGALALKGKLAQLAGDRAVVAAQHLVLAAQIESGDPAQALAAYRTALSLDPESLAAARGLSRAAWAFALPEALAEAARAEARVTRDYGLSCDLLLRAAELRERSGDHAGTALCAQEALEYDPSHARAAEMLSTALHATGEYVQLAEWLARAAEATQDTDRRAQLYTEVARIRAQQLRNLPAALSAAERALAAKPDHADALLELARSLAALERWEQSAEVHERRAGLLRDPAQRADAQLELAVIAAERLNDSARAHKCLRAVLAAQPENRKALALQVRLHTVAGKHGEALALLRKLIDSAADTTERAGLLLELAAAEEREGKHEQSVQTLGEALALEGPGGVAELAYRDRIGTHATHDGYIDALRRFLKGQIARGEAGGATVLVISRAQLEGQRDRAQAKATLRDGVKAFPDDMALCAAYAAQLTKDKEIDAAIALLRGKLERSPQHPALWEALSAAHRAGGRAVEALSSALPLLVLDVASGEQRVSLQTRRPRPADTPASFSEALVRELDSESVMQSQAATLTQILAPTLAKLRPVDLASYGVTRRDRVPEDSDQTVRKAIDRVARILGTLECDVYLHDLASNEVALGLGEPPALLVPRAALSLSKSQLVFTLVRSMFCMRYELSAVAALPAHELATLLAGAVRRHHPGYGKGIASEGELDEAERLISKALPWLSRKRLDDAAAAVAAQEGEGLVAWCKGVKRLAARVALLLSDDLAGALELLSSARRRPTQGDPVADDLLRLWASDLAVRHRARLAQGDAKKS